MASSSSIEWMDTTWNPVVGCTKVSEGCRNCYAATMARRLEAMGQAKYVGLTVKRNGRAVFNGKITLDGGALYEPRKWRKPRLVFVNSMSDLFHEDVPEDFIGKVFAEMAMAPRHTFQVLTKRPERAADVLPKLAARHTARDGSGWPLPNVWLGTSVENQAAADERIPHLLRCPAAVRFLSCEPLLGAVELCIPEGCRGCNHPGNVLPRDTCTRCGGTGHEPSIDWVIVGGESGAGARPCDIDWIRSIVGQCKAAGVPCFVKQMGSRPVGQWLADRLNPPTIEHHNTGAGVEWKLRDKKGGDWSEWPDDLRVREFPAPGSEVARA